MSDRQAAYNLGWNYIDATRRLISKMSEEEKVMWDETEALVKQYGESKEVIDMETQKAEEE